MFQFSMKTVGVAFLLVALICTFIVQIVIPIRETAKHQLRGTHLRQVVLALCNYHDAHGEFPIAIEIGPDGSPWCSWRTKTRLFMETGLFMYDFTLPWDSPQNLEMTSWWPVAFICPSLNKNHGSRTNFVVVVGDSTAFPPDRSVDFGEITDGIANTILCVESTTTTPIWTEPKDLELDTMSFQINDPEKPSISGHHPKGALACFADGAVYLVTKKIKPNELRALLTVNGGEDVSRADLVKSGALTTDFAR